MRSKKKLMDLLVVLALFGAVLVPCTCLAENEADSDDVSIGTLSNRYESLESLESATDTTDNVVTSTRIGVLTGSNRAMDGDTVSFSGEVVGDIMNGDADHKWLNVLGSDGSCIGVWVDNSVAEGIENVGRYDTTGAKIQVRGIYSIDCQEHQGELDVHAQNVEVLDDGGNINHYLSERDIYIGFFFFALGIVLLAVFFGVRSYIDKRDEREESERRKRRMGDIDNGLDDEGIAEGAEKSPGRRRRRSGL